MNVIPWSDKRQIHNIGILWISGKLKLTVLNAQIDMNRVPNVNKTLNIEAFNKKIFYGIYVWFARYPSVYIFLKNLKSGLYYFNK